MIGRRVAGGRPVLVAGAALSCPLRFGYGGASADGAGSGAVYGEWPGERRELSTRDLVPGVSTLRSSSDSALLMILRARLTSNLSTAF